MVAPLKLTVRLPVVALAEPLVKGVVAEPPLLTIVLVSVPKVVRLDTVTLWPSKSSLLEKPDSPTAPKIKVVPLGRALSTPSSKVLPPLREVEPL